MALRLHSGRSQSLLALGRSQTLTETLDVLSRMDDGLFSDYVLGKWDGSIATGYMVSPPTKETFIAHVIKWAAGSALWDGEVASMFKDGRVEFQISERKTTRVRIPRPLMRNTVFINEFMHAGYRMPETAPTFYGLKIQEQAIRESLARDMRK